jgi:hypothetical protein
LSGSIEPETDADFACIAQDAASRFGGTLVAGSEEHSEPGAVF